jgi:uncharacterized lipoprotein YajG
MLRDRLFIFLLLPAIGLAVCSATTSSLSYTPPTGVITAAVPVISAVTATDQRKEAPNRLATIMGGFGNPLKTLDTSRPVKDEVAAAFADGLRARGLLQTDGRGPFQIQLLIRKFDADMIMGRTARIDLDLTVIDQASQQVIYQDTVQDQRSDFALFATGVFANIEDLQKLAQTVLDATVNRMLDKPEFRAALARRRAPTS